MIKSSKLGKPSASYALGELRAFAAFMPPVVEADGQSYLKNGWFLTEGYDPALEPYAKSPRVFRSTLNELSVGSVSASKLVTDNKGTWLARLSGTLDYKLGISTDNGDSWQEVQPSSFNSIALNEVGINRQGVAITVGANSGSAIMLKSTDRGANWVNITTDITSSPSSFNALKVTGSDTGVWFILGASASGFRSDDDGLTWTDITGEIVSSPGVLATDNAGTWLALNSATTLRRSTDDGLTWATVSNGLTGAQTPKAAVEGGGVWLIGYQSAICKSVDGGLNWTVIHTDTTTIAGSVISINLDPDGRVFICTSSTNYISDDYGDTLEEVTLLPAPNQAFYSPDTNTWIGTPRVGVTLLKATEGIGITNLQPEDYVRVL